MGRRRKKNAIRTSEKQRSLIFFFSYKEKKEVMSSLQVEFLLNSHSFQYYDQNTICANAKKV